MRKPAIRRPSKRLTIPAPRPRRSKKKPQLSLNHEAHMCSDLVVRSVAPSCPSADRRRAVDHPPRDTRRLRRGDRLTLGLSAPLLLATVRLATVRRRKTFVPGLT